MDNVGSAVLLLLEFATIEGWPDMLFSLQDTDANNQYIVPWRFSSDDDPDLEAHERSPIRGGAFSVIWLICGHFVLLNMVISIILTEFTAISEELDGSAFMSPQQTDWVRTQLAILDISPPRPLNPPSARWRRRCFDLVTLPAFEIFMACVIFLNACCMGLFIYSPSSVYIEQLTTGLFVINYIFVAGYTVEMALKLAGLGLRQYVALRSNCYDFALVLLGFVEVVATAVGTSFTFLATTLRVVRLVRVLRILRFLYILHPLRTMTTTIALSLPAVGNVSVLLVLGLYVYAAVCVQLFWTVDYTPPLDQVRSTPPTHNESARPRPHHSPTRGALAHVRAPPPFGAGQHVLFPGPVHVL